jgi:hypothetical protein
MLTVHLNALLTAAHDALLHGDTERRAAVASQINDVLTNHATAILAGQRTGGKGRTASVTYKVAITGGAATMALGGKGALAELQRVLASLGQPRRAPSLATLQVALSRKGLWACTVETENGAVEISVTKP